MVYSWVTAKAILSGFLPYDLVFITTRGPKEHWEAILLDKG